MISKQKIFFLISLAFFQIFYLLAHYSGKYLNLFFLLTCLTAIIVCHNLYQLLIQLFTGEKAKTELNLLEKQYSLTNEHLLLMKQQKDNTLKTQQQFIKKLQTIQNLLHINDFENAHKLICETLESFQHDRFHPYCEDNLILAILESKRTFAQYLGIQVYYKIFLPEKSIIQSSDLSSVLFNIMDNAIEACNSSGSSETHISLILKTSKGFLSILVRNSKNPQTKFSHTTTKKDSFNHGLGLSIVEDIRHKYDGSWQWNDCGNVFESIILLRYQ